MITHKNLLYSAQTVCYYERTVPERCSEYDFMPLTHVFGQCHIMNSIVLMVVGRLSSSKGLNMDSVLGLCL